MKFFLEKTHAVLFIIVLDIILVKIDCHWSDLLVIIVVMCAFNVWEDDGVLKS